MVYLKKHLENDLMYLPSLDRCYREVILVKVKSFVCLTIAIFLFSVGSFSFSLQPFLHIPTLSHVLSEINNVVQNVGNAFGKSMGSTVELISNSSKAVYWQANEYFLRFKSASLIFLNKVKFLDMKQSIRKAKNILKSSSSLIQKLNAVEFLNSIKSMGSGFFNVNYSRILKTWNELNSNPYVTLAVTVGVDMFVPNPVQVALDLVEFTIKNGGRYVHKHSFNYRTQLVNGTIGH